MGRGEMPSEPGDSWFSPKCIEVQPGGGCAGVEHWIGAGARAYQPELTSEYRATHAAGVRRRVRRFIVERATARTVG